MNEMAEPRRKRRRTEAAELWNTEMLLGAIRQMPQTHKTWHALLAVSPSWRRTLTDYAQGPLRFYPANMGPPKPSEQVKDYGGLISREERFDMTCSPHCSAPWIEGTALENFGSFLSFFGTDWSKDENVAEGHIDVYYEGRYIGCTNPDHVYKKTFDVTTVLCFDDVLLWRENQPSSHPELSDIISGLLRIIEDHGVDGVVFDCFRDLFVHELELREKLREQWELGLEGTNAAWYERGCLVSFKETEDVIKIRTYLARDVNC